MGGIHPIPPSYLEKNMRSIILIFILVITVGEYFSLYAQQDSVWENVLITDTHSYNESFVADSIGNVYFITHNDILKTTDNGDSWISTGWIDSTKKNNRFERPLIMFPDAPALLHWSAKKYCTVDKGKTWIPYAFNNPKIIAGSSFYLVFPSGKIWMVGSESKVQWDTILDTYNSGSLIARSEDTCKTWNKELWEFVEFYISNVSSHSDGRVCLFGIDKSRVTPVKTARIGGLNDNNVWDTLHVLPQGANNVLFCNDKLFCLAYSGIYIYDFLKQSWKQASNIGGNIIMKKNSKELFLFNIFDNGIIDNTDSLLRGYAYSDDGGLSWQLRYNGTIITSAVSLPNGTMFAIRFSTSPLMYGIGYGVPVRSTDNGETWQTTFTKKRLIYVESVSSMPNGVILAAASGLYRSTDEGLIWESMGLDEYPVKSAVETTDGTLYASLQISEYKKVYNYQANYGICILRSTDKGKTWTDITPDSLLSGRGPSVGATLALSPSGSLFAYWPGGMLRLSKQGKWTGARGKVLAKTISVRCDNICFGPNKTVIAVSPFNMEGVNGGVWHSTDDGETWTKHPLFDRPPWDTIYPPRSNPDRMEPIAAVYDPFRQWYVLTIDMRSYSLTLYSTDGGKTFHYRDDLREIGLGPRSLTCDSLGNYYFNQLLRGIYSSTDGGMTWNIFSPFKINSIPGPAQLPVIVSKKGYLWSADNFSGLWRSRLRFPPVGVREEGETLSTLRIMPNPANTFLSLSGTDNALVFIADMQGSLVYQGYENSIDISRWQTGMYCARIPATGQKALFMVVR
jgi:photosystem II stability/assembly factor-like uncharacterized protein